MSELSDRPGLGEALSLLANAMCEENNDKLSASARLIELLCDQGYVSRRTEPFLRAAAAFAFEACGESPRSRRSYNKLGEMTLPLEEALGSKELAKKLTQSISHYGLRDVEGFRVLAESLFDELKKQQTHFEFENGDYVVSLGMVDLLLSYCESLEKREKFGRLATKIESLNEMAKTDATPWLSVLAQLVCYSLGAVARRSIIHLELPTRVQSKLYGRGITELWIPQAEAVEKGVLRGKNIVYSTGTATGKSLLAYMLAGSASIDEKVVYIVPTRTLAHEAFENLTELVGSPQTPVAISTREKSEFDHELSEYAILVSTYEKLDSLLRQGKIKDADIKCLIADEVHFISNRERGIPLEFTLAKMKSKVGPNDPQIVTLSAMIGSQDATQLSAWLNASLVRTGWRPVELDEMIFYKGKLHHKEGSIEDIKPRVILLSDNETKMRQRVAIATRLVRDILVNGGQCMLVVRSRRDAEDVAEEISRHFDNTQFFDPDSRALLSIKEAERERLRLQVQLSEPKLPVCARKLMALLKNGVAYHHAGLPMKYREMIESGIRKQLVKVLVTTTTFEVGVNLPVSTVIFFDLGRGKSAMSIRTYRNLAGRAGRPEFDVKGESIIIVLSEEEFLNAQKLYFLSEEEPLDSSIQYFMKRQPVARYAVQSEILEVASELGTMDFQTLIDLMSQSWFWLRADDTERKKFTKHVQTELWKLQIFNFIEKSGDVIRVTGPGKIAGRAQLSPFSIRNLIDNARIIFKSNYDPESKVILLLSLVGIAHEVGDNDEVIARVETSSECKFVSDVLKQDATLKEPADRIQLCPQYATVLRHWVNSVPTEEILRLCALDMSSDAALLEEMLPNDAYWILSTIALMPDSALGLTHEQRDMISKLANDCKFGSSDSVVHELLKLDLRHIGRNTAIELANHMRKKGKSFQQLTELDVIELFPTSQEAAKLLFSELKEKIAHQASGP